MSDFEIKRGVLLKYNGDGGDVVIPEGVTKIAPYAFEDSNVVTVKMPSTLTKIGLYAFADCCYLKSIISMPENVAIEPGAFLHCKALADDKGFVIVNGVLFSFVAEGEENPIIPFGVKVISDSAFHGCYWIKSVNVPVSVEVVAENVFAGIEDRFVVSFEGKNVYIDSEAFAESPNVTVKAPSGGLTERTACKLSLPFVAV